MSAQATSLIEPGLFDDIPGLATTDASHRPNQRKRVTGHYRPNNRIGATGPVVRSAAPVALTPVAPVAPVVRPAAPVTAPVIKAAPVRDGAKRDPNNAAQWDASPMFGLTMAPTANGPAVIVDPEPFAGLADPAPVAPVAPVGKPAPVAAPVAAKPRKPRKPRKGAPVVSVDMSWDALQAALNTASGAGDDVTVTRVLAAMAEKEDLDTSAAAARQAALAAAPVQPARIAAPVTVTVPVDAPATVPLVDAGPSESDLADVDASDLDAELAEMLGEPGIWTDWSKEPRTLGKCGTWRWDEATDEATLTVDGSRELIELGGLADVHAAATSGRLTFVTVPNAVATGMRARVVLAV